jgi:heme/copper-type cytochrome/quinol oxidase subunit 1
MGAGADVNAFFGVMTMLIAVPTGVKVFIMAHLNHNMMPMDQLMQMQR